MRRSLPLIAAAMLLSWLYVHERFSRDEFDRAFSRSLHLVAMRYMTLPVPHGWAYRHVQSEGKVILVSILIPKETAKNIGAMPDVLRRSVVSVACPQASDNIWLSLPIGAQISVRGESPGGKRISTVVCGG
jgi:hypothetical protein